MNRTRSLLPAPLLVALLLAPSFARPTEVSSALGFVREPLILFDTTVSTFPGQAETSLVAYNDGRVVFTSNSYPWSSAGEVVFVATELDPSVVHQLHTDVLATGVVHLEDAIPGPGEVTITVLDPDKGRAHTVTYGSFSFPHLLITRIVNDFVASHVVP